MRTASGCVRAMLGLGLLAAAIGGAPAFAAPVVEDETITSNVKAALAADPALSQRQILVNTFQRRVQLTGFVDSQREATKAVELARDVEGVRSVQNNLMLAEGPGPHIIPRVSSWQSAYP